jgi:hypothetical protein
LICAANTSIVKRKHIEVRRQADDLFAKGFASTGQPSNEQERISGPFALIVDVDAIRLDMRHSSPASLRKLTVILLVGFRDST